MSRPSARRGFARRRPRPGRSAAGGARRSRRAALAALVALAAAAALPAAPARAQSLARLTDPGPFAPVVRGDRVTVRVPLELAEDASLRELTVDLVEVALPDARGSLPDGAVTARLAPAEPRRATAAILEFASPDLRHPGDYLVELLVRRRGERAGASRLRVTVRIAAAELRAPAPLKIEHVKGFLGIGDRTSPAPLLLRETSRRSRVTDLTIVPVQRTSVGSGTDTGIVRVTGTPRLAPGGLGAARYELDGDFPLGTTTGVLEADAPQLETFTPIPFEVRARRAPWVILLVLALGLAMGYAVRVGLARRINDGRTRLQAIDLRDRIGRELRRRGDADFHADLRDALEDLEIALRAGDDTGGLDAKRQEAARALERALADLQERRETAERELRALRDVLAFEWLVPASAQACLEYAREQVAAGAAGLRRDDAAGALATAHEAERDLTARLTAATERLVEDARPLLELLDPAQRSQASLLDTALNDSALQARARLQQLAGEDAIARSAAIARAAAGPNGGSAPPSAGGGAAHAATNGETSAASGDRASDEGDGGEAAGGVTGAEGAAGPGTSTAVAVAPAAGALATQAPEGSTAARIRAQLAALHVATRTLRGLTARVGVVAHRTAERSMVALRVTEDPVAGAEPTQAAAATHRALLELDRRITAAMAQGIGSLAPVAHGLEELLNALSGAVLEHAEQAPMHRPVVEQQLALANFEHAAVAASRDRIVTGTTSGSPETYDAPSGPLGGSWAAAAATIVDAGSPSRPPATVDLPASAPREADALLTREATVAAVTTASRIRTTLVAAVLLFMGYVLFADSFTGTARELLGIFLWAFATDITVDRIVSAATEPPAPPTAPRPA